MPGGGPPDGAMPGGGNGMPAGGDPEGAPPVGGNPGGRPCGSAGIPGGIPMESQDM